MSRWQVQAHGGSAPSGDVMQQMGLSKYTGDSATYQPATSGSSAPCSVVELAVACRNLVDMDVFSKSDPMCVLYVKEFGTERWKEFGRTEVIWNNLNPDFVKKFVMDYFFEESQKLKFEVYDVDSKSPDLSKHDFLGTMECTLGEVVSSARLDRALKGPKKNSGAIVAVTAEELSSCKDEFTAQFSGHKLDKKDFFGKSDPFLKFYRTNEDRTYTVVHQTEVIKNTLNPTWRPFTVPVRALCNGDYDRALKVECYDWDRDGGHDLIGAFTTTLRELSGGPGVMTSYEVIHPKKQAKKGKKYKGSGTVKLMSARIVQAHSFLDYIKGGTEVHCTIAVDFTASNGDPRNPNSLHFINPYEPNLYARALKAVGDIIQDYDTDKLFPALGFGARLPPDGVTRHDFFLVPGFVIAFRSPALSVVSVGGPCQNGHPSNPYCQGIEGVLEAYNRTIQSVQLYGPTNFAPVINHVASIARTKTDGQNYFILLILTDGIITDMPQTSEAIVQASNLPLSIIIVGIGDADFEAMNVLDGDDVRLSSRGRVAERDIVQFVPFREFIGGRNAQDLMRSQALLAKEVLAEIPEQFLSYMKKHGIKPRPALQRQSTLPTAPPK